MADIEITADTLDGAIERLQEGVGTLRDSILRAAGDLIMTAFTGSPQSVQNLSPIDRGEYKAGHVMSVNAPSDFTPPHIEPDVYRKAHSGQFPEYVALQEKNVVDAIGVVQSLPKQGDSFDLFIANNVEYAERIEEGSSTQAGSGVYSVAELALAERMLTLDGDNISISLQNQNYQ